VDTLSLTVIGTFWRCLYEIADGVLHQVPCNLDTPFWPSTQNVILPTSACKMEVEGLDPVAFGGVAVSSITEFERLKLDDSSTSAVELVLSRDDLDAAGMEDMVNNLLSHFVVAATTAASSD
jgi:hypothetical protein